MSERVLVTGAAGFIGSHLCRRLVADGATVIGLDDLSENPIDNLRDVPEVDFIKADLLDQDSLGKAANGCTTILHQGAKRSVPRSVLEPELTTRVNLLGTLHVLLAARDVGASVVSASSSSVYGDQETFPVRESMKPAPLSPYAASKLAGEVYCAALARTYGVRSVSLRYFNVFGPAQDPKSEYAAVVPRFVVACLTGERPVVYGDGSQARDFTYIDDVVEANLRASRAGEEVAGVALNIGGGRPPTSVMELLTAIADECGVTVDPIFEPARDGDVKLSHADVSLARELIGFEPAVDLPTGIRRTVDWFRSRM